MAREIAVFRGGDGLTATLGEPGKLTIFRRWQGSWQLVRETECFLDVREGLRELRRKMAAMLQFLGDCRIFVAKAVTGVPYYELEKAGFNVWEYAGEPVIYLDQVWAQEEKDALAKAEAPSPATIAPYEKEIGYFSISLKEIQEENAGITSKQVLQPFIRKREFRVLEVVCSHVPPWLEAELATGPFTFTTEQLGKNEIMLKIIHK